MKKTRNDNLFLFFFVTLAWTWFMGFLPLIFGLGETFAGDMIFKLTAGPVPSFVALILVFATYNKEQKKDYFKRIIDFKQMGIKWLLLAMIFFSIVCGLSIFISVFFIGGEMPEFGGILTLIRQPYMIFFFLFLAFMSGPFNEEFGWRGFALDRLFTRYGFWIGSMILGFIWGIWHLPWYFYPGNGQYIWWHLSPIHGIMYIVSTITLSCIISIVYIKTNRSILSAFFVHMISNFFTGSVLIYPFDDKYIVTLLYVTILLEILVILYFFKNTKFQIEIKEQIASINVIE
jgi:membrane protease YdiL (CAAX protease family)